MSDTPNQDEFYEKLKGQLLDTAMWPSAYLYKFIIKTNTTEIKKIETLFNNMGAVINTVASKNGKYTSLSINVRMKNPDEVIAKYKEVAEKVDGVISL
jgi:putative lipoic acid-binding regulatory protein